MKVSELVDELDTDAGPEPDTTDAWLSFLNLVRRRKLRTRVATGCAVVAVLGSSLAFASLWSPGGGSSPKVVSGGQPSPSTAAPSTTGQPAITAPSHLPADCDLVSNRSGTLFGCARPSEQPRPGQPTLPSGDLGARVYDIETNTAVIGYIGTPAGIGFVPLDLAPQYDALVACNKALTDPTTVLTSDCHRLLIAQGVPQSQFDGR